MRLERLLSVLLSACIPRRPQTEVTMRTSILRCSVLLCVFVLVFPMLSFSAAYEVTKLDDDGSEGTLRWAIIQACDITPNQHDVITFDPSLTGTIYVNNAFGVLPTLDDPEGVDIQGETSIDGIVLDGSSLESAEWRPGFYAQTGVGGGYNRISSLEIRYFETGIELYNDNNTAINNRISHMDNMGIDLIGQYNTVSGNTITECFNDGIIIYSGAGNGAGDHSTVIGNYIGTTAGGDEAIGNGYCGIRIQSDFCKIMGNVISGNGGNGIEIQYGANLNEIYENLIGTTPDGQNLLANGLAGILFFAEVGDIPHDNRIGGPNINQGGNTIVDDEECIVISGPAYNNYIQSNKIGTNIDGTVALGGSAFGIASGVSINYAPTSGGTANLIGGPDLGDGNLISGHIRSGVIIKNSSGLELRNNLIGTDISGQNAIPNGPYGGGIYLLGGNNNIVISENVVSGNLCAGILMINDDDNGADDNCLIQLNAIGVALDKSSPLGNARQGIHIDYTSPDLGNIIGPANIIAYNNFSGIYIEGNDCGRQTMTQNLIYGNGNLGIDLGQAGVTENDENDADEGPNDLLNFPVFDVGKHFGTAALPFTLTGSACPDCIVELFQVNGPEGLGIVADPSGHGEGYAYLQSAIANAEGHFEFADLPGGIVVTATATDGDGNTSEFAENYSMPIKTYTVVSPASTGAGSLAAMINSANDDPGPNVITFSPGISEIVLTSPLPAMNDVTGGTFIDGCTGRTTPVVINGSGIPPSDPAPHGLTINSDGNEICGLAIISCPGAGVYIDQANYTKIYNCLIGLDADGTTGAGNENGIEIIGQESVPVVGTEIGVDGKNVISGNILSGIQVTHASEINVQNNYIGTDADGLMDLGNGVDGIQLMACSNSRIEGNLVSGNDNMGLDLVETENTVVVGNKFGITVSADFINEEALPNGIAIEGLADHLTSIGGNLPEEGNIICGSTTAGISLLSSTDVAVVGNNIGVGTGGVKQLPNATGFRIENASNVTIGGTSGAGNIISGNNEYGINAYGSTGITIQDNTIAENGVGSHTETAGGLFIHDGSQNCEVTDNVIHENNRNIVLRGANTYHNLLTDNVIYGRSEGPDIDLFPYGITAPDGIPWGWDPIETGPNEELDFPSVYLSATQDCFTVFGPYGCDGCYVTLYMAYDDDGDVANPIGVPFDATYSI